DGETEGIDPHRGEVVKEPAVVVVRLVVVAWGLALIVVGHHQRRLVGARVGLVLDDPHVFRFGGLAGLGRAGLGIERQSAGRRVGRRAGRQTAQWIAGWIVG